MANFVQDTTYPSNRHVNSMHTMGNALYVGAHNGYIYKYNGASWVLDFSLFAEISKFCGAVYCQAHLDNTLYAGFGWNGGGGGAKGQAWKKVGATWAKLFQASGTWGGMGLRPVVFGGNLYWGCCYNGATVAGNYFLDANGNAISYEIGDYFGWKEFCVYEGDLYALVQKSFADPKIRLWKWDGTYNGSGRVVFSEVELFADGCGVDASLTVYENKIYVCYPTSGSTLKLVSYDGSSFTTVQTFTGVDIYSSLETVGSLLYLSVKNKQVIYNGVSFVEDTGAGCGVISSEKYDNKLYVGYGFGSYSSMYYSVPPSIVIDSQTLATDESNEVTVAYTLTDADADACSVTIQFSDDGNTTYKDAVLVSCDEGTISGNTISGVSSLAGGKSHWFKYYVSGSSIRNITANLKKQSLKTHSKITITRDPNASPTDTIVMGGTDKTYQSVSGYSLSRSRQLGAAQISLTCSNEDGLFSPERQYTTGSTPNAINYVGADFKPLYEYGNKIKVEEGLEDTDGNVTWFDRFVGWISTVTPSNNEGYPGLEVIAFDNVMKLTRHVVEDKHYVPDSNEIEGEALSTSDSITFEAAHSGWVEYPPPVIYENGERADEDDYVINYLEGKVIFRGAVTEEKEGDQQGIALTNPSGDRKTWVSSHPNWMSGAGYEPVITYYYEKCTNPLHLIQKAVDHTGGWQVCSETAPSHTVDHTNGQIVLDTALGADVDACSVAGQVTGYDASKNPIYGSGDVGNKRNQVIKAIYYLSAVDSSLVKADYHYALASTNEVEDMIRDLADDANISSSYLEKSVTDEDLHTSTFITFFADYNNWKRNSAVTIKKAGTAITAIRSGDTVNAHSAVTNSEATITFNGIDLSGVYTADRSVVFSTSSEHFKISSVAYASSNTTVTLDTTDTTLPTIVDGTTTAAAWEFHIDYKLGTVIFQEAVDEASSVSASYSYYTLQSTGITLSSAHFTLDSVDNAFDAIDRVLNQVAPNYIVRCDGSGYLVGEYESQKSLYVRAKADDGYSESDWDYSSIANGDDYKLKLTKRILSPISDENIYTQVIQRGSDPDPENMAISASRTIYKPLGSMTEEYIGSESAVNDYNVNTSYCWHWYADGSEPWQQTRPVPFDESQPMVDLTLVEARKVERIDVLVGVGPDGHAIGTQRVTVQIKGETGDWVYPSRNQVVKNGQTGSWISWNNEDFEHLAVKYVRINMEEPFWYQDTTVSSGKKSTDVSTVQHALYSIGEIQVWATPDLVGKANLDNVIMVGNGSDTTCYIPNVPYVVIDFASATYGWTRKAVSSVTLYKNNLSTALTVNVDYTLNADTGLVDFQGGSSPWIPATDDVIAATYTLDSNDADDTTYTASFANKELLQKMGLRAYKPDKDEGLETHLETIDRAANILPEVTRLNHPLEIDVMFRPDMNIMQTVLVVDSTLGIERRFLIEEFTESKEGFVPSVSIKGVNYL